MAVQGDIVSRYESKYIIPRSLVAAIREYVQPFCEPDPNTRGDPPEYSITTLQLETPQYALHYAKEDELDARFKMRVRTYGEIGSAPIFAEIKAKFERTIVKVRACVPFNEWGPSLIYGSRIPPIFKNKKQEIDFLKFRRVVWETAARPEVLVRYTRESYIGVVDDYVRITFDRKLQYQKTDSWTDFGRSGIWRGMDSCTAQGFGLPYSGVVLEVKTYNTVPTWVIELVKKFELKRSGNCKYSTAIWKEASFSGYPSTNFAQQAVLSSI